MSTSAQHRWEPFHTLLACLLLTYVWRVQDFFPLLSKIKIVTLVSAAALLVYVIRGDARHFGAVARHPAFRPAVLMLALMVLSVPGGVYPGYSFRFILEDHIKTLLVAAMLATGVQASSQVDRLAAVHVLGALLYSVMIALMFDIGPNGRLAGLAYYDANDVGMLLVATLPLTVYFLRPAAPTWQRLLALVGAAFALLTIVKTGSRGAFLGLLAVTAAMLFGFTAFSARVRAGSVAAIAAGMLALGSQQYWAMMGTLLNPQADYNWVGGEQSGRMEVWKRGMGYMADNPVLGVGANAFWVAEGRLSEMAALQQYGIGMKWSAAHNSFVQIGAELGVIGLVAFCVMLARAVLTAHRLRALAPGATPDEVALGQALAASLVGYAVAGFFLSQAYSVFLYSVVAMIVALHHVVAARAPLAVPAPAGTAPVRRRGGGWGPAPVPVPALGRAPFSPPAP
jgi:O-antigen ligase